MRKRDLARFFMITNLADSRLCFIDSSKHKLPLVYFAADA